MRSFNLSILGGLVSLALLATAPSEASAQRLRPAPIMPRPAFTHPASTFVPHLGVQPSSFVGSATIYPYSPRTGTFSAVGVTTAFSVPTYTSTFPTYGSAYNGYVQAAITRSYYQTYYGYNPYAPAAMYNPYLNTGVYSYNPYLTNYNPYLAYSSPYYPASLYSGGYSSPYMNGAYATSEPASNVYTGPTRPGLPTLFVEVGVYDNRFEPKSVTVSVGTTVRWTNYSDLKHTVTSDNGLWDSRGLNAGATTSYTFTQPGKYIYHSSLNPEMTGTVIVQ